MSWLQYVRCACIHVRIVTTTYHRPAVAYRPMSMVSSRSAFVRDHNVLERCFCKRRLSSIAVDDCIVKYAVTAWPSKQTIILGAGPLTT